MSKTVSYAQWALEAYCIGMKLRTLRTRKRLTLSRLSAETGLSTALLSKLETDRMIPTLSTLATIARVYGVGMSYFFTEPAKHSLSITRKAHLHSNGRSMDTVRATPLNIPTTGLSLVARMIEISPGTISAAPDPSCKTSTFLYVIEGRLQLDSGGMAEILEAGDCACIESEMSLAWTNASKHRCRLLAVTPAPPPPAT